MGVNSGEAEWRDDVSILGVIGSSRLLEMHDVAYQTQC
eukprot:COSAG02_NODE_2936_length_7703_cov_33.498816_4_plen_38_part_00